VKQDRRLVKKNCKTFSNFHNLFYNHNKMYSPHHTYVLGNLRISRPSFPDWPRIGLTEYNVAVHR
jgi:hypothetical protein